VDSPPANCPIRDASTWAIAVCIRDAKGGELVYIGIGTLILILILLVILL
jgi:hypothetical protein